MRANTTITFTACRKETLECRFADTFYWIALTLPRDPFHSRAQGVTSDIVTTDEVLAEYLSFFSGAPEHYRRKAGMTARAVVLDSSVRVLPQSRESFLLGLDLYLARADKGHSMIDCSSMAAMGREGLTDVLTNDKHFEQEGFRALFRV